MSEQTKGRGVTLKHKNKWEKIVDMLVDSLGYAIVRFAPVIAPIPSIAVILEVSGYSAFAWATVVTIEMVGYAIGDKMVEAVRRNVLGLNRAILPIIVYALVIEGLMLGYKVIPSWMGNDTFADAVKASVSMLYPFFTLAGAGLYAFHEYLKEVETDANYEKETERERDTLLWQDDRNYRNREREVKLSLKVSKTSPKKLSTIVSPEVDTFTESVIESVDESLGKRIVRYFVAHPGALLEDVAGHVGKSVPVVSKEIKGLVDNGALHKEKQGRRQVVTVNGTHEDYLAS